MTKGRWAVTVVATSLALVLSAAAQAQSGNFQVLVFTGTEGAQTAAIDAGVKAIRKLGRENGFNIVANDNPREFDRHRIVRYDAIVFLNTTGDQLSPERQTAFENWFRPAAASSASTLRSTPSPAGSSSRTSSALGRPSQTATDLGTIKVADRVHDASKDLPEYWNWSTRWYNFAENVRGLSHVLMTVVEEPFAKQPDYRILNAIDGTMGADHPVAWCKDYQGGRSFYTSLGSSASDYSNANLLSHLNGAIQWAAGESDPVYSDCGATVRANYQQSFVAAPPNLSEPIGFDVLPDGIRPRDPDRPSRRRPAPRPGHELDHAARDDPRVHQQRGRALRPRGRQQLQHEQVGVPVLRAPDGQGREAVGRLDRHADDAGGERPGDADQRDERADDRLEPERLGSVHRLLPALSLQVRGRDCGDRRRTSTSRASRRSCGCRTTAARAATSRATSTSTRRTTSGSSRVTTRPPAAATPARTRRSATS